MCDGYLSIKVYFKNITVTNISYNFICSVVTE